jgi:hypothetical protein
MIISAVGREETGPQICKARCGDGNSAAPGPVHMAPGYKVTQSYVFTSTCAVHPHHSFAQYIFDKPRRRSILVFLRTTAPLSQDIFFMPVDQPWNVYREQLSALYHGYALWEPSPMGGLYDMVSIGDVGYVYNGSFYRMFNVTLPWDDPSNNRLGVLQTS